MRRVGTRRQSGARARARAPIRSARAAALGITPLELVYDALLGRNGEAILYLPTANYVENDTTATLEMLIVRCLGTMVVAS